MAVDSENIKKTGLKLRVSVTDLPKREDYNSKKKSSEKPPSSKKGEPCERTCDCAIGLVCYNGLCIDNW